MKNKIKNLIYIFFFSIFLMNYSFANEEFEFNVTQIEIKDNGNRFLGLKRGVINSSNGIIITADTFDYNKKLNFLIAEGNVSIEDKINNFFIFSNKITYNKKIELINSYGNSKALSNNLDLSAVNFIYDRAKNILIAQKDVKINNKKIDYQIFSEEIKYFKDIELIKSYGDTLAIIYSDYEFKSKDVLFNKNLMELSSNYKTSLLVKKKNFYEFDEFKFLINKEILKASNIYIKEDYNKTDVETDKLFFKEGFFNLKEKNYIAGKTEIKLKKNTFGNLENDPRLIGVSSLKKGHSTFVNKGIFTSCKIDNNNCPPWSIKASKIEHNKQQKKIIYDNAFLQVYDFPILYFPRFFHPDPSVQRQSGFLNPTLNNSNFLGSSINIPYYKVISDNEDYTFTPTLFDKNNMFILQNEYRKQNKNSYFITDISFLKNFISTTSTNNKSITHLFSRYNKDLNFLNYNKSDLEIYIEKTSNNLYPKLFDSVLSKSTLWPKNNGVLESGIDLKLEHSNFSLIGGFKVYEDLSLNDSDSFQYNLPYYNFSKNLLKNNFGSLDLISRGDNTLINTNNLKTKIINDLSFTSKNYISNKLGFMNNYELYFKNLNSLGKKDTQYKNQPQSNISSILQLNSSWPLIKITDENINLLTPKISFKTNPSHMVDYKNDNRKINSENIFDLNRLGLDDTLESGNSLTLGIDYNMKNKLDESKYFKFKLATSFRNSRSEQIPITSSLHEKNSNLFGALNLGVNKYLDINYNFALDNKLKNTEYNELEINYNINKFNTKINWIEESNIVEASNYIENISSYEIDKNNFISFKTRRNQRINLTEYYDLVYEYKNDCLTAGIKYKKSYYQDRDIKPTEDLMFTVSFFPLTTFEQKIDTNSLRN